MLWVVILNNLALNQQTPLNHPFAWSCTIGESDIWKLYCKNNKKYVWAKLDR